MIVEISLLIKILFKILHKIFINTCISDMCNGILIQHIILDKKEYMLSEKVLKL